jgi:HEAT repeat protein
MNRRWRELAVAGHTGDLPTARSGLTDPDPEARCLALGALDRLAALTDDELAAAMRDLDADVRRRAVELCAKRPHLSLLGALHDDDPIVVEVAAWACGEHELVDGPVLERLCDLATAAEVPLVREAAVAALGAIGDERGLAAILAGCDDLPAVRRRAVLALAPFDGDDVEAALTRALTDRDWQVRQAAEDLTRIARSADDESADDESADDESDDDESDDDEPDDR